MKNLYILSFLMLIALLIAVSGCEPEITSNDEANPYIKRNSLFLSESLTMNYLVLMPESYDSTLSYPVLLALPPGAQTVNEVEWATNLYYIRQSIQRNWLVVSPVAPNGILFHEGAEVYIPFLLDEIEKSIHVENGKFHLAGISNGGISAFRLATGYPDRFQSVTVFPGKPLESDKPYLENMVGMKISMYVGANDAIEWVSETEQTAQILDSLGATVTYKIWANDGHIITSLNPQFLFDLFDTYRQVN